MEALISLIFGGFSGWLAGENKNKILGRMVAFSAFITIAGLYAASVTAEGEEQGKYFSALGAFAISFLVPYYIFGYIADKKSKKENIYRWKDGGELIEVSDYIALLNTFIELSEEQMKQTANTITSIKKQYDVLKDVQGKMK